MDFGWKRRLAAVLSLIGMGVGMALTIQLPVEHPERLNDVLGPALVAIWLVATILAKVLVAANARVGCTVSRVAVLAWAAMLAASLVQYPPSLDQLRSAPLVGTLREEAGFWLTVLIPFIADFANGYLGPEKSRKTGLVAVQ